MSFIVPGENASVQVFNRLLKLGYGDTSELGDKEVRLKLNSGKFQLVVNDAGTERVVNELTAQELLNLLITVAGPNSGLDADTVDGQEAAAFATWRDCSSDFTDSPLVQSGEDTASGATITFDVAYTATPRVIAVTPTNSSNAFIRVWGVSTTGFSMKGLRSDTQEVVSLPGVAWIAIGSQA